VPSKLYENLSKLAQRNRRSLSAEVIALLGEAVENSQLRVSEVRASLEARRKFQPAAADAHSTLELLREDRDA
jgi:hypothetical protein